MLEKGSQIAKFSFVNVLTAKFYKMLNFADN